MHEFPRPGREDGGGHRGASGSVRVVPSKRRASFHSRGYLRRVWGSMFEILDIIPAANGFLQDYVVLRRPG